MKKRRLFSVNGPTQMLNVLTLIDFEARYTKQTHYDYLVINGTGVNDQFHPIYGAIERMSKLHKWEGTTILEDEIFTQYKPNVPSLIGVSEFDELFLVRNWGNNHKDIINSYPAAKVIIYGDSLGFFDCILDYKYPKVHEVKLITPIMIPTEVEGLAYSYKLDIIPRNYLLGVIDKLNISLRDDFKGISINSATQSLALYITNYYSKANLCTFEQEIELYVQQIIKTVHTNEIIIIKPHPRDDIGIAKTLLLKINQIGYKGIIANGLIGGLPIEIIIRKFNLNKVIGLFSAAFIGAKFVKPEITVITEERNFFEKHLNNISIIKNYAYFREIMENISSITQGHPFKVKEHKPNFLEIAQDNKFTLKEQEIIRRLNYVKIVTEEMDRSVVLFGTGGYLNYCMQFINYVNLKYNYLSNSYNDVNKNAVFKKLMLNKEKLADSSCRYEKKPFVLITSSFVTEIEDYLERVGYQKFRDYIELFIE